MSDHTVRASDLYPYNISVDVGGVTFTGPGADTREEAERMADIVEKSAGVDVDVEVFG